MREPLRAARARAALSPKPNPDKTTPIMKNPIILVPLLCGALLAPAQAGQTIAGSYETVALEAPAALKSGGAVTIAQDAAQPDKITVSGLIPGQSFHAALEARSDDGAVYSVPEQTAGTFAITRGSVVFDAEEGKVTIMLNDKPAASDDTVTAGAEGVSAGGVKIGSDGSVSAAGAEVSAEGVKVESGAGNAVSYIGVKKS